MLKRNFFCTVAWSWILLLVIYHSSSYNLSSVSFCYYFIHIQGETVKNCSEIDCTLYLNHLGTVAKIWCPYGKIICQIDSWKSYFFLMLAHKINLIPPMLKRNVFCTVVWSKILLLAIYHVSCYNFCFFLNKIFQGKAMKTVRKLIELSPSIVSYDVTKIGNRVSPSFVKMYLS